MAWSEKGFNLYVIQNLAVGLQLPMILIMMNSDFLSQSTELKVFLSSFLPNYGFCMIVYSEIVRNTDYEAHIGKSEYLNSYIDFNLISLFLS